MGYLREISYDFIRQIEGGKSIKKLFSNTSIISSTT
jgi:hypothetical protein